MVTDRGFCKTCCCKSGSSCSFGTIMLPSPETSSSNGAVVNQQYRATHALPAACCQVSIGALFKGIDSNKALETPCITMRPHLGDILTLGHLQEPGALGNSHCRQYILSRYPMMDLSSLNDSVCMGLQCNHSDGFLLQVDLLDTTAGEALPSDLNRVRGLDGLLHYVPCSLSTFYAPTQVQLVGAGFVDVTTK